jgi:shikimate kinase
MQDNIILIGMPGAGKSTVGVILAKRLGFQFFDTDLLIQAREKKRLQQIIDNQGVEYFRQVEEQVISNLQVERSVIATGGSVIYYPQGFAALRTTGHCVYLQVSLACLKPRIADMGQRGLVMAAGQTFADLYYERTPLYQQYADISVNCDDLNTEQAAAAIEGEIDARWPAMLT